MAISAHEAMNQRKRDDWNDMMAEWLDDPEAVASHMAFGMDLTTSGSNVGW